MHTVNLHLIEAAVLTAHHKYADDYDLCRMALRDIFVAAEHRADQDYVETSMARRGEG